MVKQLFIFLLVFIAAGVFSQKNYNKLSFELASGFSKPLSNISTTGEGTYITSPNWNIGLRYMFNSNLGLKGSFNFDEFKENGIGTKHHRFNLDGYYNIGNWFDLNYVSKGSVALYSHFGIGATYVNSTIKGLSVGYIPGWERQLDTSLGLSPRFRLSDAISVFTDINYIMALKQHFNYSGEPIINAGSSGVNGAHFTVCIGFSIVLDNKYDDHVDFY
jgi:hypothetical protein